METDIYGLGPLGLAALLSCQLCYYRLLMQESYVCLYAPALCRINFPLNEMFLTTGTSDALERLNHTDNALIVQRSNQWIV